jgi:hypothetical protein
MKSRILLIVALAAGAAAAAWADDASSVQVNSANGAVTVTGSVVKYEPGRTIVVREPDQRVVTYNLAPSAVIPTDVQVGRTVTLYSEPNNPHVVTKVTTTEVTPEGTVRKTTQTYDRSNSTTKTVTVYGTVQSYQNGRTVTITEPNGRQMTYDVDASSQLPPDLRVGKKVTIITTSGDSSHPVVKTITYTTKGGEDED